MLQTEPRSQTTLPPPPSPPNTANRWAKCTWHVRAIGMSGGVRCRQTGPSTPSGVHNGEEGDGNLSAWVTVQNVRAQQAR